MARYALRDALQHIKPDVAEAMLEELRQLEDAISLLDHRRYDAECRRADALLSGAHADVSTAQTDIARLVAQHRHYSRQALRLRDAVLLRLDAALSG